MVDDGNDDDGGGGGGGGACSFTTRILLFCVFAAVSLALAVSLIVVSLRGIL